MKKILIILLAIPTILYSQDRVQLSSFDIMEINEAVRNCLEDYEKESKVTSRNEDYFYELFSDNERLIDDVIPSPSFGSEINSEDWIKLMKGINLYNIETEVLDWESYNPVTVDSGYVIVKVRKTVLSAMWSDRLRKDFNIVVSKGKNDEITQKVRYSSDDVFRFKFIYSLNSEYEKCIINRIQIVNDLKYVNVYVPYKKELFRTKQLMEEVRFDDTTLFARGDNIKYFIDSKNLKIEKYKISGFRKPKLVKVENSIVRSLVYNEKINVTGMYSQLVSDNANMLEFGISIQPSSVEHNESTNFSVSVDLYKFENGLLLGLKGQFLKSSTRFQLNSYENISVLENPILNNQNTYLRKNLVSNFDETLALDQKILFFTAKYKIKGISLFGSINLYNDNALTSKRTASAKYSGVFEDFNIEIDEPINYSINGVESVLDLGYKEWDVKEDIEFIQELGTVYEIGASYSLPISIGIGVNIFGVYKLNTSTWFAKTSEQISPDKNDFNSFVSFSDKIQMRGRVSLGVSLNRKF